MQPGANHLTCQSYIISAIKTKTNKQKKPKNEIYLPRALCEDDVTA